MPPTQPQVPFLDSFRGLAAIAIVVYHRWLLSGEPALGGGPVRDVLSSSSLAVTLFRPQRLRLFLRPRRGLQR